MVCPPESCFAHVVLAVYLLRVSISEGQFGGHMEHNFLLSVDSVDRLGTGLTMGHIQTPPEPEQREGSSFHHFLR